VAGDGLRRSSGESAELPTEVKEVLTLLGKSRQSISNAMGVRFIRGIASVSGLHTWYARPFFHAFLT
jgi:hypothetical protein